MKRQFGKTPTQEEWTALTTNNKSYDGEFIYAVTSTGICCRPSCQSRNPKFENIRIFQNIEAAIQAGFRPCKRCKPSSLRIPAEEWVLQINYYIEHHFHEHLTLDILADACHGSPYHLQKIYKKVTGYAPIDYIQHIRVEEAKVLLKTTQQKIEQIGQAVGFSNTPYFITLFKKITGLTPRKYRFINGGIEK
ncbi:bifunctional transcriptional activator/DNA repair enzyme AdaA [Rummeliibacillus pycnus]|uniref:bifunctional transcriptional activator/DNA repair enzyme AdaA n=1 Tax=Rummeliibacillus pycnus TaxID=101070 RepID=UPI0037C7DC49